MPTPNMSDEELDSLFQRGAEAYPDDSHLAGWERMEAKLDAATTTQALRQKVKRIFIVEILVLGLLLWQGYRFAHSGAGLPAPLPPAARLASSKLAANAATAAAAAPGGVGAAARLAPGAARPTPFAGLKAGRPPRAGTLASALAPASPVAAAASEAARVRVSRAGGGVATAAGHRASGGRLAPAASGPRRAYPSFGAADRRRASRGKVNKTAAASATVARGLLLGGAAVDSLALKNGLRLAAGPVLPLPDTLARLALQRPADSATAPRRRPVRPPYRVVVGVLGAPAASAVRTAQTARLGGDFGLTLEYRLSARLRVRTGLISSEKRYDAPSNSYTVPTAWQWYPADYVVDASCRITEIPLDLRYDVLSRPTLLVFASLGVNSLLMRDERYSYDWMHNGQTYTKSAHVVNGSNHVLSILNISAGVERPLGARWAMQVEPFLQVPLAGVGAGRVRLSSAGAAFSVKFGLFR